MIVANSLDAATPVLTMLPVGYTWDLSGTNAYDTTSLQTERGGTNGQGSGPYNDTSFGVMNEAGTPWNTGNDFSNQQFVQNQFAGNFGTNSPPGPGGARFYNDGTPSVATVNTTSPATSGGGNFPGNALENRSVSLTNWNNTNPDTATTATPGQVIFVPTAAYIKTTRGFGADAGLTHQKRKLFPHFLI